MKSCYRCFVEGNVQGVFFRGSARRQAQRLGVTGYARNLPDGRVEVLLCGEQQAVDGLRNWLWSGPPAASIKDVQCEPLPFREIPEFTVK